MQILCKYVWYCNSDQTAMSLEIQKGHKYVLFSFINMTKVFLPTLFPAGTGGTGCPDLDVGW